MWPMFNVLDCDISVNSSRCTAFTFELILEGKLWIIAILFVVYSYPDSSRNIFNTIKTSGHSSLEKYTSHFIWKDYEGCYYVRGELETEQNCSILTPHSSGNDSLSFPSSWASQTGTWGSSIYWDMLLITASNLQLIWTSCRRGYIIILRPPTSCERHNFALNSTPRQSRSPLISWYLRPDAPVIYTGPFLLLTAWPGSICNMFFYKNGFSLNIPKRLIYHKKKWNPTPVS